MKSQTDHDIEMCGRELTVYPPKSEPPVRSSEWLDRAIAWVEYSAHKPWCNVAPGNIYASDGDPCDCGRDTVLKDLNAARSNDRTERPEAERNK